MHEKSDVAPDEADHIAHYASDTREIDFCQVQVISEQQFALIWDRLTSPVAKRRTYLRMMQTREPRRWYGLGAVASILNLEEWQIKALCAEPYGLVPEKCGKGRGSRNLYSFRQLLQVDLATTLTRKSQLFTSELIPAAVRVITKGLVSRWIESYVDGIAPSMILAFNGEKWRILSREESSEGFPESLDDGTIWVSLNLVPRWESIVRRISELEGEGKI